MATGYIYIFTNPSFKEYVKLGYAKDVKQRLYELNRSSAVPFAFRVFATYEVDSDLSDKKLHSILDKLYHDDYSKVKDCEVLHWGIHNSRPSTIILYV